MTKKKSHVGKTYIFVRQGCGENMTQVNCKGLDTRRQIKINPVIIKTFFSSFIIFCANLKVLGVWTLKMWTLRDSRNIDYN